MLPILFTNLPDNDRFIRIVIKNYQEMLLSVFDDFFREFELRSGESRINAPESEEFQRFLKTDLRQYLTIPSETVAEAFACVYSMILSDKTFSLEGHALEADLLSRMLWRTNQYCYDAPASVRGPAVRVRDAFERKVFHTIGRKICPEDRKFMKKEYRKFLETPPNEFVLPMEEFFFVIGTTEFLPYILGLEEFSPEEVEDRFCMEDPEEEFVLPGRWWDESDDFADYNPTIDQLFQEIE